MPSQFYHQMGKLARFVNLGLSVRSLRSPSAPHSPFSLQLPLPHLKQQHRFVSTCNMLQATEWKPNAYPPARRSDHVDTYKSKANGSVQIPDPYQWLEEKSPETDKWIESQVEFTQSYLDQYRDKVRFKEELTKNWDYPKFSPPSLKYDGRWYWYYNSGLKAQSVLYRSTDNILPSFNVDGENGPEARGEIYFDPNLLADDGTASLAATAFSRDGQYFAYGVSLSGSDFFTIYVRKTSSPFTKKLENGLANEAGRLSDVIRFVKFSTIVWTHDSKGFFYQRYPERKEHGDVTSDQAGTETIEDKHAMLYYHVVGTDQSEDVLVHADPENPTHMWGIGIAETDGRYLELYVTKDTSPKNKLWIADLHENAIGPSMKWHKVIDEFEAQYNVVANNDRKFFIITDKDALRRRVVTFALPEPVSTEPLNPRFEEFLPEDRDGRILEGLDPVNGDHFIAHYSRNVKDELYLVSAEGVVGEQLDPNFVGEISIYAKRDQDFFFVKQSGFDDPGTVKRYTYPKSDGSSASWETWRRTHLKGLNLEEFQTEQVWYESTDGTKIPMFVVKHKDTPLDGTAPAMQYGYGGFSISMNPFFSPARLTFIKAYGAILAVPNIRGGAEFGEAWHLAGVREKRPQVYDDFTSATNWLVKNKYAAPGKVAINGGSNGGTLVAACLNRAPAGTFGAAVADVGVHDLLKFTQFTIGAAWTSDYGDPRVPEDFDFVRTFSPLHNVPTDRVFPPTILLTADHDDRVVPLHSFKHAATLQHLLSGNPHPLLIRVDTKSGHGAGKSTEKVIQEAADKWGFVAQSLGLEWRGE